MSKEDFDKFSVYGFSIDYPAICYVEFSSKSRREAGDIAFHYSSKKNIYLAWGDLTKTRKMFQTVDEQAEQSIKVVTKNRDIRKVERVTQDSLTINSHKAVYNRLRLVEAPRGFGSKYKTLLYLSSPIYLFLDRKPVKHEAFSVHLHCERTSRYFVIYSLVSGEAPENFPSIIMSMMNSFQCH